MDALGLAREVGEERLRRREVRVLIEEVMLGNPHVLEAGAVGLLGERDVVHEADVLVVRVFSDALVGDVTLKEEAEFHGRELLSNEGQSVCGRGLLGQEHVLVLGATYRVLPGRAALGRPMADVVPAWAHMRNLMGTSYPSAHDGAPG